MIKLNDYLYSGDTVLRILQKYNYDLRKKAVNTHNSIDLAHSNFLLQIIDLLEHNGFLTDQSDRIREFYLYLHERYPYLSFVFKGRIKSLLRAEQKFNGYITEYVSNYYEEHGDYPPIPELKKRLQFFRDLIAYRIIISLPKCQLEEGQDRLEVEHAILYDIAEQMIEFLEERGFTAQMTDGEKLSDTLNESVRPYYRDYITHPTPSGYQSLHVTFYDNNARCFIEIQLRTKTMDDHSEIGPSNHFGYEQAQKAERRRRDSIPVGEFVPFDEAYERGIALQTLDLSKVDVNMFYAINNTIMNDLTGLYRGRLIRPYEHLSRFQKEKRPED